MHNQNIFQLLQQREATADQLYSLDSQDSRQLRNIYIAIMAVFLPLIFVKRSKNSNEQVKRTAQLAILILIPSLLYLNADSDDNLKRSYEKVQIMHISLDTLANSKHMKNTWYGLDYSLIDQQLSNVPHPLLRKFQRASNPNPETVLFYWVPWIIIYLISCKKSEAFAG